MVSRLNQAKREEGREKKTEKERKREHMAEMTGLYGNQKLWGGKSMDWRSLL